MTPEEADRKMEFILEMSARNATDIAALQHSTAELRQYIGETNVLLRDSIKLEDARISRLDNAMARLAEAQRNTEERLNALIGTVERHIAGPDHGHPVQ